MLIFTKLILAHIIGDFVLQPRSWVQGKEAGKAASPQLYFHIGVHTLLAIIILWGHGQWLLALCIAPVHFGIDAAKLYFQKPETKARWFIIDQLLHIGSLAALWYIFVGGGIPIGAYLQDTALWIWAAALLFLCPASKIIIGVLLEQWAKVLPEAKNESLADAGTYIGMLERVLVLVFVATAHWEAVGFLLAAKSVFRFGDLTRANDRKLTEYILIGTLLSFGIAIATGMAVAKFTSI